MGKRRLGRGLDALLGRPDDPDSDSEALDAPGDLRHIRIDAIHENPYQPRSDFDPVEMKGLTESVLRHGVVQPIVVRPVDGHYYQLVAGQRRLRAAVQAGLSELPARIVELEDRQLFEIAIVENLQRQDLNAIEKGAAFQDYLNRFGVTHEELAERLGIDRSTVTNFLRLLELPDEVQQAIRRGSLSASHARALLPLMGEAEQLVMYRRIRDEGLSVRQVESAVAGEKPAPGEPPAHPSTAPTPKSNHVLSLEKRIREAVGSKVEIKLRGKERGRLVIHFNSNDQFKHLMEIIFRDRRQAASSPTPASTESAATGAA